MVDKIFYSEYVDLLSSSLAEPYFSSLSSERKNQIINSYYDIFYDYMLKEIDNYFFNSKNNPNSFSSLKDSEIQSILSSSFVKFLQLLYKNEVLNVKKT